VKIRLSISGSLFRIHGGLKRNHAINLEEKHIRSVMKGGIQSRIKNGRDCQFWRRAGILVRDESNIIHYVRDEYAVMGRCATRPSTRE